MRTRTAVTVLATFCALGNARAAPGAPSPQQVRERADAYLEALAEAGLFSGAVLLARRGEVVVESAYGSADIAAGIPNAPATQFKLMSVSKSLTAVAVFREIQEGRLGLEDPVGAHLSSWPEAWRDVTVHHLLDHTSGIPNLTSTWAATPAMEKGERGLVAWREIAPRFASQALDSAPGSRHAYSNFNYVLLGLLVEAASGRPYAEALRTSVLAPAGMTRTTVDDGARHEGLSIGYFRRGGRPDASVQDMSRLLGAGGMVSTAGDLYRLDRALRGDAVLSPTVRSRMLTPRPPAGEYACGWMVSRVFDRLCVHHSGGANGYVADLLRFPDDDACVVVLSNFAFAPIGRLSHDLAGILFGRDVPTPKSVAPDVLATCSGTYRDPRDAGHVLVLRVSGSAVVVFDVYPHTERPSGRLLVPVAEDRFLLPWGDETARYVSPAEGRPSRLEIGSVVYERIAPSLGAWQEATGRYRTDAPGEEPATLDTAGEGLLFLDPGRPPERALLPISDRTAIAFLDEDGAFLVHLERDADGRTPRLRWKRGETRTVVAVRETAPTPDGPLPAPAAPFEVLVLATIHAPFQFRSERFTPAHVRAALEAARPDVVGVESPPEWLAAGRFHDVTYEAQAIAVPYARSRGIPVVGIDWQDLPAREQRDARAQAERLATLQASLDGGKALPFDVYGRLAPEAVAAARSFFQNPDFDFELVNGVASDAGARAALGGADPASPSFGGHRNREIAARCIRAMEGHAGGRLVVVIGAGHKAVLDALFEAVPGVRVLGWGRDVASPSVEALDRAWTRDDVLAVLGHNLDGERSYFHPEVVDLRRMRALLDRLAKLPGSKDLVAYFGARVLATEATRDRAGPDDGRWRGAREALASIDTGGASATPYPFPMDHWRMRYSLAEAVRLERARLALEAPGVSGEDREAAKADLAALLREREANPEVPVVEEDVLGDPGFEADTLPTAAMRGWASDDARPEGRVRGAPDETVKVEGRRALRVELVAGNGLGTPRVTQGFQVPESLRGKSWEFSLQLRGDGISRVSLVAYRMEDGGRRAVEIAKLEPVVGPRWRRANLSVPLPREAATLRLFCYFEGPPGARLWLDDAKPLRAKFARPTVAELLAGEFPRTLLLAENR